MSDPAPARSRGSFPVFFLAFGALVVAVATFAAGALELLENLTLLRASIFSSAIAAVLAVASLLLRGRRGR